MESEKQTLIPLKVNLKIPQLLAKQAHFFQALSLQNQFH